MLHYLIFIHISSGRAGRQERAATTFSFSPDSSATNAAFKVLPIKSAPQEVAEARLALFLAARHTLAAGMALLGLRPMTRM